MAIYHLTTRAGHAHVGQAGRHAEYIEREGIYQGRSDLIAREIGNMPTWAKEDSAEFWRACDDLERANGRAYREFEVALPRELPHKEQAALVRQFVSEQLGDRHAYTWAIHDKGDGNPHAHIMFSERIQDGIDRPKEQYFKRANGKIPEHGGCRKDDRWNVGRGQKSEVLFEARARWADLQNVHLERAEELSRVDHRSLEAQGIERTPQVHVGFRHQDRPEVRAERHQRNEDLKLASQEPQARDQLATCQADLEAAKQELEEITATLREMEARTPKDLKHSQLNLRPVVPERPKVQAPTPMPPKPQMPERPQAPSRPKAQVPAQERQEAKKIETVPERPPEVNQVSRPVARASVKERLVDALQALLAADAAYLPVDFLSESSDHASDAKEDAHGPWSTSGTSECHVDQLRFDPQIPGPRLL